MQPTEKIIPNRHLEVGASNTQRQKTVHRETQPSFPLPCLDRLAVQAPFTASGARLTSRFLLCALCPGSCDHPLIYRVIQISLRKGPSATAGAMAPPSHGPTQPWSLTQLWLYSTMTPPSYDPTQPRPHAALCPHVVTSHTPPSSSTPFPIHALYNL